MRGGEKGGRAVTAADHAPAAARRRYVSVSDSAGRALFYVLTEAVDAPESAPVVLWLNGGPGCSSMGSGFMSEMGPFFPAGGSKRLERNLYAWNRVANVLFLDSPAFVGWSYSNTSAAVLRMVYMVYTLEQNKGLGLTNMAMHSEQEVHRAGAEASFGKNRGAYVKGAPLCHVAQRKTNTSMQGLAVE